VLKTEIFVTRPQRVKIWGNKACRTLKHFNACGQTRTVTHSTTVESCDIPDAQGMCKHLRSKKVCILNDLEEGHKSPRSHNIFPHEKLAQRNFFQHAVITSPNTRAGRGIIHVFELRPIYVKPMSLNHSIG
jgi:hypothetical protein